MISLDFFKSITNEDLDSLNMELYSVINNVEYQNYYTEKSSKEHYRLLTYLSNSFANETFTDIGTLLGSSALALSTNKTNKIFSFNLYDQLQLNQNLDNVDFIIDDVTNGKYDDILIKSKFILLDTFHDGTFEEHFFNYLLNIGYKGYLLLDDIHLNNEMEKFWQSINIEKYDLTNVGHSTGTGVVLYN